jgi:beta-galactosidase
MSRLISKHSEEVRIEHPTSVTRRDFLKSSALTAAAAFIPISNAQTNSNPAKDAFSEKLTAGWEYFQGSLGGVWDVWRGDMTESTVWKRVQIPHCFNARDAVDPDQPHYEGPGWYRRKLQVKNPFENGRTLLLFEGAGQKCEVFLSLERVGQHIGGYDEFVVDITEAVAKNSAAGQRAVEVPLAVLCDNSRDSETIPSSLNDFHRFGGLYRGVSLIYVPAISLERVHIRVDISNSAAARVSIKARLYNPVLLHEELQLQVRIFDPQGSVVNTTSKRLPTWAGDQEISTFNLASPQLWSPSQPSLYRCEVQVASNHGTMTVSERFGCRYFEFVEHGPFKINGERLFLKGTQREEDHAGVGAAMSDDLIRQEMLLIKEMGANFVGLGHHQQSRTVLNQCDELGLLVLEQIPWTRGGLGGEGYKQMARNMLAAMIDQHYNHPSVILWGLGNENDWPGDFPEFDKEKIRGFVKELNDDAHRLDPSRPTFLRRCDFCKDLVDVYSPSIWAGWYHGPYTQYKNTVQKESQSVPRFLHVEWGAESHALRHSEDPDRLLVTLLSGGGFDEPERDRLLSDGQTAAFQHGDSSETYACNLFDWHLKEQETMLWLPGSAQWIFKDFATPLRPENPIPHVNQKGLLERDMTLKEGYYVFQSYWAEKPMIHIYGHSWPTRWGEPDELKLVKVYSNCETVELLVNGASQGAKRRNSQDFPAAGLHWLVKFKPGDNRLSAVGHSKTVRVEDAVDVQYQTDKWGAPARIELGEIMRDRATVKIQARLLDGKNTLCLAARDRVWFGLTGDGTFLDNTGTSSGSRCVELYNGRAEIRLLRNDGISVVSVRARTVPTAFLTVK